VPGICVFCLSDEESIDHIFPRCPFSFLIWELVTQSLNLFSPTTSLAMMSYEHLGDFVPLKKELGDLGFSNNNFVLGNLEGT